MPQIAVFPGSFDPFTLGHHDIVTRADAVFDKVIIGIGFNSQKKYYFPLEKRLAMIRQLYVNVPSIEVASYEGLTVDFCKANNASIIVRGLRSGPDFEFEQPIAQMNKTLAGIETVFLMSAPEYGALSSTIVREIMRYGGDVSQFLPEGMEL